MKSFAKYVFATVTGMAILIGLIILIMIAWIASKDKKVTLDDNTVLHLQLNYPMPDRTVENPFAAFAGMDPDVSQPVGLYDLLAQIKHAKGDDKIKGIFLDLTFVDAGFGKLSEIRDALVDFRESGKFVVTYSEVFYNHTYYLASASDEIYLNPQGSFLFNGMLADVTFVKDAMKKLGIELQPIKRGKFKGAVEPFVLDSMSDANRHQITVYLNSIYETFIDGIAKERNMTPEEVDHVADQMLVRGPEDAVKHKLVDHLMYRDQVLDSMKSRLNLESDDKLVLIKTGKYRRSYDGPNEQDDKIAVVFAEGSIVGGKGKADEIGGETYAATLRSLRKNEHVKGVVLRINSGGGSALASDVIWREAKLLSEEKPLIVSMGDVAASGGYYIACVADSIFALKNTITGSIGVFGLYPNVGALLDNIGVHNEYVGTGEYSEFGRIDRPLNSAEFAVIDTLIAGTYRTFLGRVAEGRGMTVADVDSIGQGRVWTGEMALDRKLIDAFGGINKAIEVAAYKGGVEEYQVVGYPKQKNPLEQLFGQMDPDQVKGEMIKSELGDSYKYYQLIQKARQMQGVQAMMPFTVTVQ